MGGRYTSPFKSYGASNESVTLSSIAGNWVTWLTYEKLKERLDKVKKNPPSNKKKLTRLEKTAARLGVVLAKMKDTPTINPTAEVQVQWLGGSNVKDIDQYISNNVIKQLSSLINKTRKQFDVLSTLSTKIDNNGDNGFEDDLDKESKKMTMLFKSAVGSKGITISGYEFYVTSTGFIQDESPDDDLINTPKRDIKTPSDLKEGEIIANLATTVIELWVDVVKIPIAEYAQSETFWILTVEDLLDNTANALIEYLDNSYS